MDQHSAHAARPPLRFSTPILAQVLEHRSTGFFIGGLALVHLGLTRLNLPAWQCPMQHALGLPCPGCGLSRAMAALLQGDWQGALARHAFAPLFLLALGLIIGMAPLPEPLRRRGITWVARFEERTSLVALLLVALVAYWLTRLLFFRSAFIHSTVG
jgi:hypothetical protein